MKKKLLSVVTLLLVATLLFGVFANVAFAADLSSDSGNVSAENGANNADDTTTEAGGSLDAGWLEIIYDENKATVVVYPDFESLKNLDRDLVKEIKDTLVEAAKTIVFDDIKQVLEPEGGEGEIEVDSLWTTALGSYIENNGYGSKDEDESYFNFFKAAVASDYVIDDFVNYLCDLISLMVQVPGEAGVDVDSLPAAEDIREKMLKVFNDDMNARIDSYVDRYVAEYLTYILCETDEHPELPDNVAEFVDGKIWGYVDGVLDNYRAVNAPADGVEELVFQYLGNEIKKEITASYVEYRDFGTCTQHPELLDIISAMYQHGVSVNDALEPIYNELKTNSEYADVFKNEIHDRINDSNTIEALHTVMLSGTAEERENASPKITDVVNNYTSGDDFREEVVYYVVGLHSPEFDAKIESYVEKFLTAYTATVEDLKRAEEEGRVELDLETVFNAINKISVNGDTVYGISESGVYEIDSAVIKGLIGDLPRLSELGYYSNEQMEWSWHIAAETGYGNFDFGIGIKIGGGHGEVRRISRLLTEYVDVYIGDNGEYVVNLNVPERLSRAILKACQSDKISDELKHKIFAACTESGDDVYALYNDLTFADITELLEKIDFEGILTADFVANYVDLSGLSDEEITEKVKQFEKTFNKLKYYVNQIFDLVPDYLMDETLVDLYNGNGNFGYDGTHSIYIEEVLYKISSKYGPTIAAYFDKEEVTVSVDFDITFEKINRVKYIADGAVVREGFLPAGADVEFFANITEVNGNPIIAWVDENLNAITEMPDRDIVLTAVADVDYEIITGSGVEKVYDGDDYILTVRVGGSSTAQYRYEWYRDGELIVGATDSTLAVKSVSDTGVYKCIVYVTDSMGLINKTLTSEDINVKITPKSITVNNNWQSDDADDYVYDGNEHSVEFVGLPAGVTAILDENVKIDAGDYRAYVTDIVIDPDVFDAVNYVLDYDLSILVHSWSIEEATVDLTGVKWDYRGAFEYDGSLKTVLLKSESLPEGNGVIYEIVYSGNEETESNAADYTATAEFKFLGDNDKNYDFDGDTVITLPWQIKEKVIVIPDNMHEYWQPSDEDAPDFKQDANTGRSYFVYDGSTRKILIPYLTWLFPEGYGEIYDVEWNGTSGSMPGIYTATATFYVKDGYEDNYGIKNGTVMSFEWEIKHIEIDLSGVYWNYSGTPFVYSGEAHSIELVGLDSLTGLLSGDKVSAVYNGTNEKTAVGTYTAEAELVYNTDIYKLVNVPALSRDWEIKKRDIDLSGVYWNYSGTPFVYSGEAHSIELVGLDSLTGLLGNDKVSAVYNGTNEKTAVSPYTAEAELVYNDEIYNLVNVPELSCDWEITKKDIDLSGVYWNYSGTPFEYNEGAHSIELVGFDSIEGLLGNDKVSASYTGNSSTEIRKHTAIAELVYNDEIYNLVNVPELSCEWEIVMGTIVVPDDLHNYWGSSVEDDPDFEYDEDEDIHYFVYDGTEREIRIPTSLFPAGYEEIYDVVWGDGSVGTIPGDYEATVTFIVKPGYEDKYGISGAVMSFNWRINKAKINLSEVEWNYSGTPFKFNRSEHSIELVGLDALSGLVGNDTVVANYDGTNVGTAVGKYTARAELVYDQSKYVLINEPALSCEWEIEKGIVDLSGAEWVFEGGVDPESEVIDGVTVYYYYYDGEAKKVNLVGLPQDIYTTCNVVFDELSVTEATYAGSYVVKVTITPKEGYELEGYELEGAITLVYNWQIRKHQIHLNNGVEWDYSGTPFEYDGESKQVSFSIDLDKIEGLVDGDVITADYNGVASNLAVGSYTVTATLVYDHNKYEIVDSQSDEFTCDWEIDEGDINVDGVYWVFTDPESFDATIGGFYYDGEEKSLELRDLPAGLGSIYKVEYVDVKQTKAGQYQAQAVFTLINDSYLFNGDSETYTTTFDWCIAKYTLDLSEVEWNYIDTPFAYNGEEKSVALINLYKITGLVDGDKIEVNYNGTNERIAIGEYTAVAEFVYNEDKYELVNAPALTCEWEIVKGKIDLTDVKWSAGEFIFNENEQSVWLVTPDGAKLDVILPVDVSIEYVKAVATNAGTYNATATVKYNADNYDVTGDVTYSLEWKIDPRVLDFSGVKWNYEGPFTYNGETFTVELVGLPEQVSVTYTSNSKVNADEYTAKPKFSYNSNYTIDAKYLKDNGLDKLDWEIKKADVDLSGITFKDKTYKYSQDKNVTFNIEAEGLDTLMSGVNYEYSAPVRKVGTYTVTLSFSLTSALKKNYNVPKPMTATLTIENWYDNEFEILDSEGKLVVRVDAAAGVLADRDFVANDISANLDGFELEDGRYAAIISAYDITFRSEGTYMPVNDNFTVKMRIPATHADKSIVLLYIDDNGNAQQINGAKIKDGDDTFVVFGTSHFSIYAIGEITDPPVEVEEGGMWWLWLILILIAVILLLAVIIVIVKRRKGNDPEDDEPTDSPDEPTPDTESASAAEETSDEAPAAPEPEEEAPAEAPAAPEPEVNNAYAAAITGEGEGGAAAMVDGEVVMVRYRSSFQSRIIQADADMQEYYGIIKNALLSYKGVKARTSWNYESFNKGRIQCAKLNLKGRTITVYLGLDPAEYNVNKYHFTDVSDKPKMDKVPMLMKVRSERSLKYTLELIEEMMNKLEIPADEVQNVDYRMPYESTEDLVKRGLVKVILPPGMTLDANSNIVKLDVGALIDNAKRDAEDLD